MALEKSESSNSRGFSLVEVIIAMGILTAVSLGVAQLFAATGRANLVARGQTSTTAMAQQKMEQLRSLTWGFDGEGLGLPVTDTTSNVAAYPQTQTGTGLNPSPANSLHHNIAGFVDFLDATGTWVGTGTTPPAGAVYVRRWSIEPLPTNPNNTIIIQVLVSPLVTDSRRATDATTTQRQPGDALLVTVKTRKAA